MIKPFEDAHLDALELSAAHRAIAVEASPTIHFLSSIQHAGTIVAHDGAIVGVYGAGHTDAAKLDEVAVFLFLDKIKARRYAKTLVKDLRQELVRARMRYKYVKANGEETPMLDRWFRHLGFQERGTSPRGGLAWA